MLLDISNKAHCTLHFGVCQKRVSEVAAILDIYQLIYSSRPFGYDQPTLDGILLDARRCNCRDEITGALVCRHDVFVQFLEGDREKVSETFERIRQDDRHVEVKLRYFGESPNRAFPKWAMLHDPARSWLWSAAEVDKGALDRASVADYKRIFRILATNIELAVRLGR